MNRMNTMSKLTRKALEEHNAPRVAEQKEKDAAINGGKSSGVAFDRYGHVDYKSKGLTKREHFAGLAMQGIISADTRKIYGSERVAIDAINYADALLKELEK